MFTLKESYTRIQISPTKNGISYIQVMSVSKHETLGEM